MGPALVLVLVLALAGVAPMQRATAASLRDGGLRSRRRAKEDSGGDDLKDLGYMAQVLVNQRGRFKGRPVSKRAVPVPPVDPMEVSGGVMPIHPGIAPDLVRKLYNGPDSSLLQAAGTPVEGPMSDKDTEATIVKERVASVSEDSADVIDAIRRGLPRPNGLWARFKALRGTPVPPVDPQSYSGGVRQLTMADIRPFKVSKSGFAVPGSLLQTGARHQRVSVTGEEAPATHHHRHHRPVGVAGPGEQLHAWGVDSLPAPMDQRAGDIPEQGGATSAGPAGDAEAMRFRGVGGFGGRAEPMDDGKQAEALARSTQAQLPPEAFQQAGQPASFQQAEQPASFQQAGQPASFQQAGQPSGDPLSTTNMPSDDAYQSFRSVLDLGITTPVPRQALEAMRRSMPQQRQQQGGMASDLTASTASGLAGLGLPQDLMAGLGSIAALAGTPQQQPPQRGARPEPRFAAPAGPPQFPPEGAYMQQRMQGFAPPPAPQAMPAMPAREVPQQAALGRGGAPPSAYHQLRQREAAFGQEPAPPQFVGPGATPGGFAMGTAGPMDMRSANSGDALRTEERPSAYGRGVRPAADARFRAKQAHTEAKPEAPAMSAHDVMDGALDLASASQVRGFRDALSDIGLGAGSMSPSV